MFPQYSGLLQWLPEKDCWEISVTDHSTGGIRIQPRGMFGADALLSQARAAMVPTERVELTGYTCELYRPTGRSRASLAGEGRRLIIMLGTRYMLHNRRRVEWHLARQRYI